MSSFKCDKCSSIINKQPLILFSDFYREPLKFCSSICKKNFTVIVKCSICSKIIDPKDFSIMYNNMYICSMTCRNKMKYLR